jgi:kynurenine formamidase
MKSRRILIAILLLIALATMVVAVGAKKEPSLWHVWRLLEKKEFVDLTHTFQPGIPHWPGFNDEQVDLLYWYDDVDPPDPKPETPLLGTGFYAQEFTHVGQWGTHVDPPAHFVRGLRTADQIDVKEMVMPLVVIDVHEKVEQNPDYTITMDDVRAWEARHGKIPKGAFVAMRTDWSKRWPDPVPWQRNSTLCHYRLEHGSAAIPVRGSPDHRFGS